MTRQVWIVLALLPVPSLLAVEPHSTSPGLAEWKKGQQAMLEGRTGEAIASFERSLELEPALARNHLSLAAAYLGRGQDEQAVLHLDLYLRARPDHHVVRGQYADLLWRLGHAEAARKQYERLEADVQDHEIMAQQLLVHCHTRLVDIARAEDDEYALHLHRGIGLYYLACQRATIADSQDELSVEGLLCQAASELSLARIRKRDEARPCWYLHEVWSHLGQRQPATRWLRAAAAAAPFSYLTPTEQRDLYLACRRHGADGSRK
jgi:hypothetical protein